MSDETTRKVEEILRKNFTRARGKVLEHGMTLRGDLGGHDLDVVQAVMDLEDVLEVEITDDEDEALRTVGDVHALVAAKLGAQVPA